MKSRILIFILILVQYSVSAQDFSSFYSYMLNRVNINPALAGNSTNIVGIMDYRSQYNGIPGGPRNLMFALHSPISVNQGAGVKVIQDTRGAFGVTRVDGMYSHRFFLSDSFSVRFGLSVGMISRHLNTSSIAATSNMFDLSDPTLSSPVYNYTRFISGFGMLVNYKQLEVGFSAPQIIENSNSIGQYLVGTLSYTYSLASSKIDLQPFMIYQNLPVTKNMLDVAMKVTWDKKVNFIGGYATNQTIKASAGLEFNGFGVAYMYEHPTGYRKELSNGTHEIMLTVSIHKKSKKASAVKMEKDLNSMIKYLDGLIEEDTNYTQGYIRSEIENITEQLNTMADENSEEAVQKMSGKMDKIHWQISILKSKYEL